MKHTLFALFDDMDEATDAIDELKDMGYEKNISVIAPHDEEMPGTEENTTKGVAAGAVIGGLAGLLAGVLTVTVPGLGALAVAGPLLATWGITGAAAGALTGGLVGALTEVGLPASTAKHYDERLREGGVVLAISSDTPFDTELKEVLTDYGADDTLFAEVEKK